MSSRVWPHDLNAERAVLGACIVVNGEISRVVEVVRDVDFYREQHRFIFGVIAGLHELGSPVDTVTIAEVLSRTDRLEFVGGISYLSMLTDQAPLTSSAAHYAAIVRDKARRRQAIQLLDPAMEDLAEEQDAGAVMRHVGQSMLDLGQAAAPVKRESMEAMARAAYFAVEDLIYNDESGFSTGLEAVDQAWGRLQGAQYYVVYARSKMGKTSFNTTVGDNLAMDGVPLVIWTGEMSAKRYLTRMVAGRGGINLTGLRKRRGPGGRPLSPEEVVRELTRLRELMEGAALWDHVLILDDRKMSPAKLEIEARRHFEEHGPGVVTVDYLQKMQSDGEQRTREQEIANISNGLLGIAHRLNVPVLAYGQVKRGAFSRTSFVPTQDDIREGDAPFFDADVFSFIHREVYYQSRKQGKRECDLPGHRDADLIVEGARDGEPGTVRLRFVGEHCRFHDVDDYGSGR